MVQTVELKAIFPGVTLAEFKHIIFENQDFQRHFQTTQGHQNIAIEDWREKIKNEKYHVFQRTIGFETPINVPSVVQSFLGTNKVIGDTAAELIIYGNLDQLVHTSVMRLSNVPMAESIYAKVVWSMAPNKDKSAVLLKLTVTCEFKQYLPLVTGAIESSTASNSQKTFESWIQLAKDTCAKYLESKKNGGGGGDENGTEN